MSPAMKLGKWLLFLISLYERQRSTDMKCTECKDGRMFTGKKDIVYKVRGREYAFPQIDGLFCNCCDNNMLDAEISETISVELLRLRKEALRGTSGEFLEEANQRSRVKKMLETKNETT